MIFAFPGHEICGRLKVRQIAHKTMFANGKEMGRMKISVLHGFSYETRPLRLEICSNRCPCKLYAI